MFATPVAFHFGFSKIRPRRNKINNYHVISSRIRRSSPFDEIKDADQSTGLSDDLKKKNVYLFFSKRCFRAIDLANGDSDARSNKRIRQFLRGGFFFFNAITTAGGIIEKLDRRNDSLASRVLHNIRIINSSCALQKHGTNIIIKTF